MLMRRTIILVVCMLLTDQASAQRRLTVHNQADTKAIAVERGWLTRHVDASGRTIELQAIVNGTPRYYMSHNVDAADSASTDECWPGGAGGLNLTGAGVTLGIWDGGAVYTTHGEFQGRAVQMDGAVDPSTHATHVAGTMIAGGTWPGNPTYPAGCSKGMAHGATLHCHDWNNDVSEVSAAAAAGLRISNHSYGLVTGWVYGDFGQGENWYWFGDTTVSAVEDHHFGRYSSTSRSWDQLARANVYYLCVKSAGNDRNDYPGDGAGHYYINPATENWAWSTAQRDPDGDYDCTSHAGIAKNCLTVGAVNDIGGGYGAPGDVQMTTFSSWGPADDGRIKPDIVANGYQLFSSYSRDGAQDFWAVSSGTSMSSPSMSGSLGLLIEHWRQTHPSADDMRSATLKALVIHTADESGDADGPDYKFGWGLLNTLGAARTITEDVNESLTISEWTRQNGDAAFEIEVSTNGTDDELRVTLCWTDPAGTPPADTLDNPAQMLVNDLDLRVESAPDTFLPWILDPADPAAAAATGDNSTDNVEQVVIDNPGVGDFTIRVTHKGALQDGQQAFSLIITGGTTNDCNGNGTPDADDLANCDGSLWCSDCNENGILDACEADSDGDGVIDDCDECHGYDDNADSDGDGKPNGCDNCAYVANAGQLDTDADGQGDACDNCPDIPNADQGDVDADGVGNACDNCLFTPNSDQRDSDGDGVGDACETAEPPPEEEDPDDNADQDDSTPSDPVEDDASDESGTPVDSEDTSTPENIEDTLGPPPVAVCGFGVVSVMPLMFCGLVWMKQGRCTRRSLLLCQCCFDGFNPRSRGLQSARSFGKGDFYSARSFEKSKSYSSRRRAD